MEIAVTTKYSRRVDIGVACSRRNNGTMQTIKWYQQCCWSETRYIQEPTARLCEARLGRWRGPRGLSFEQVMFSGMIDVTAATQYYCPLTTLLFDIAKVYITTDCRPFWPVQCMSYILSRVIKFLLADKDNDTHNSSITVNIRNLNNFRYSDPMCLCSRDESEELRAPRKASDKTLKQANDLDRVRAGKNLTTRSPKSMEKIRSQVIKKAAAGRAQSAQITQAPLRTDLWHDPKTFERLHGRIPRKPVPISK